MMIELVSDFQTKAETKRHLPELDVGVFKVFKSVAYKRFTGSCVKLLILPLLNT